MYRNSYYNHGLLTVFFSCGSKPMNIWDTMIKNGWIDRYLDQEIKGLVVEIRGVNISTSYMTCPKGKAVLGICLPFMVMVCKNLHKYFSFEVTVLDSSGVKRRFRASTFQSSTKIVPFNAVMPICLSPGWNQIQFNLADFTRRAYNTEFVEVQNIKVNANIILRRIYFAQKLMNDNELPAEYKLFKPISRENMSYKRPKYDYYMKAKDCECDKYSPMESITPQIISPVPSLGRIPANVLIWSKPQNLDEITNKTGSEKNIQGEFTRENVETSATNLVVLLSSQSISSLPKEGTINNIESKETIEPSTEGQKGVSLISIKSQISTGISRESSVVTSKNNLEENQVKQRSDEAYDIEDEENIILEHDSNAPSSPVQPEPRLSRIDELEEYRDETLE